MLPPLLSLLPHFCGIQADTIKTAFSLIVVIAFPSHKTVVPHLPELGYAELLDNKEQNIHWFVTDATHRNVSNLIRTHFQCALSDQQYCCFCLPRLHITGSQVTYCTKNQHHCTVESVEAFFKPELAALVQAAQYMFIFFTISPVAVFTVLHDTH